MRAILGCWLNTVAQGDLPCHQVVALSRTKFRDEIELELDPYDDTMSHELSVVCKRARNSFVDTAAVRIVKRKP